MKKRLLILIMVALSACFALVGCGSDEEFLDRSSAVKVVFNFEGGKYQNSPAPLVHYYGFKKDTENLIKDPAAENESEKFTKSTVTRDDYYFDGWYRTKTEVGEGKVEYSDKWDFKKDRVTNDGVVLYAKWVKLIHYTYGVYYRDDEGNEILLDRYDVDEGDKFDDYLDLAHKRPGSFTPTGYFDEEGNPWNEEFTHPGGENNTEIKVFVEYSKGRFVDVHTADELVYYITRSRDIRLMNDIDMEGGDFSGFIDYSGIFDGGNHKISNFNLAYSQGLNDLLEDEDIGGRFVLGISLFGMPEGAEIRDISFENVTVDIDANFGRILRVIVAPICLKAVECSFTNVSFSGTYTFTRLPDGMGEDEFEVIADRAYYYDDGTSTFENVSISIDNQIQKQIA